MQRAFSGNAGLSSGKQNVCSVEVHFQGGGGLVLDFFPE